MIACTPPSGATFAEGVTLVTCTATDASGNTDRCSFEITVRDHEPPVFLCPEIVASADPGQCSKSNVLYGVAVTDNCSGVNLTCEPPEGSRFPVGVSTVNCQAVDASSNTNRCSFTVTIRDTEGPQITCPGAIATTADPEQCSKVMRSRVATYYNKNDQHMAYQGLYATWA